MKQMKKIASVILCAALLGSLTACSMVTVDKEKEAAQVVATIGEKTIIKKEFDAVLESYMAAYGYTDEYMNDPANKESTEALKKSVLDTMVEDEAAYQWALANGLDLTDEEKQQVKDSLNETIRSTKENIRAEVLAQASEDPNIDVEAEIARREKEGLGDIESDEYLQDSIRYRVTQKFNDSIKASVSVTDEQVKQRYDLEVDNQKLMLENMATYQMNISMGNTVYVYPEGTKAVKQILIAIPSDKKSQIETLRSGDNTQQADSLLQEELAKIKANADKVLDMVKAGGDFDSLIEEYGEDPGMKSEPGKTKGYYVYPGDTTYVPAFVNAAMSLQNAGDFSGLVVSDYGYHILKLIGMPDQVVPFDEVKDTLKASMLTSQQNSAISQKRLDIVKNMQVTKNYDVIR